MRGRGAVLLASRPRAIAIYLTIDGRLRDYQYFFQDIPPVTTEEIATTEMLLNQQEQLRVKTRNVTKPLKDTFMTYTVNQSQEPYCFIHLPLMATLKDTSLATGNYGESLVRNFCFLLTTLSPGRHQIDMTLRYQYDHSEYNYLVLGKTTNPLGRWSNGLPNDCLQRPHTRPTMFDGPSEPIAEGSFIIDLPHGYKNPAEVLLDRVTPEEKINPKCDVQFLRKTAMVS